MKLGENSSHPSWALGVLGDAGLHPRIWGLLDIGQPQAGEKPRRGGSHGAGWRNGGQIGKISGAGSSAWLAGRRNAVMGRRALGFDACLITMRKIFLNSWRKPDPQGIDVYYEKRRR